MVIEKVGKLPVNSRISIDYTKNPVQIDFAYPDPDASNIRKSDAVYIPAMGVAGIMILIIVLFFMYYVQPVLYTSIGPSNTVVHQAIITDFEYYDKGIPNGTHYGFDAILINYTWNNKVRYAKIELNQEGSLFPVPYFTEEAHMSLNRTLFILVQALGIIIIFIILTILNSFWMAKIFTDTKWGNRKFPEINKKLHDSKYSAEFFPQDFPVTGNTIEIPLFKNMYMDYEATGDFSEYLEKIEIIEHPFKRHIKKGLPFSKKRKHPLKKTNIYLWKTIFTFKEGCRPQTGSLIMRWT